MTLSTVDAWAKAMEALARERHAYDDDPRRFPIVLGFSLEQLAAFQDWNVRDALHTAEHHLPDLTLAAMMDGPAVAAALQYATATILATHSQMYMETGLWLAQSGRLKP